MFRTIEAAYHDDAVDHLSLDTLAALFFATGPRDRMFYTSLFENLRSIEATNESVYTLCRSLRKGQLLKELSMAAYSASEGDEKAQEKLTQLQQQLSALGASKEAEQENEFAYVEPNLDELLDKTYLSPGLRWRLDSLNKSLGSLRKSDFGFVFARPESGKTTFLTSEGSYFAEQAVEKDLGPVLHLNNEGEDDKILLRYYQSVLGATLPQILSNREKAQRVFMEKTQGKIVLPRLGRFNKTQLERLLEKHKPCICVVDQVDHIQGFTNDREDLRLGAIYEWLRELAKLYCPIIGVTQADGSGEGTKWLTMANVANAKTSKQAAADFILGIGKVHDNTYDKIRFLSLSKNKCLGDPDTDPKWRHRHWECVIEAEVARYRDL